MQRRSVLQQIAAASFLGVPAFRTNAAGGKIRIGLALPNSGVQMEVAQDLHAGYKLAGLAAAETSGVQMEFVVDGTAEKPEGAEKAIEAFGKDKSIVATSGLVGTPHALLALPKARAAGLPVVGIRSGAPELRNGAPGVFHLRATFDSEVARMVLNLRDSPTNEIGCIYSNDAFGKGVFETLKQAVTPKSGVKLVAATPADRAGADIEQAVANTFKGDGGRPTVLLLFMIATPMLRGLEFARERHSFLGPVYAMSFTATRKVAEMSEPWVEGLGIVSALPLPRSSPAGLAVRFRQEAEKANLKQLENSVTAMEGFFYGSCIAAAAARAKGGVTRESLAAALLAGPLDVFGTPVNFDKNLCGYDKLFVLRKDKTGVLRA